MNYEEELCSVILPWVEDHVIESMEESREGIHIHCFRAVHPEAKASMVIVHGFCEFFAKYQEAFYRFYHAGYSVYFAELRGYGKSERTRRFEDERVYVESFDEYVDDVCTLIEKVVRPQGQRIPMMLLAHSMGGAVSALTLERYPDLFQGAVLSSPMLQLSFGKYPDAIAERMARIGKVAGAENEYAPGQGAFTGDPDFLNSSMQDYERYIRILRLRREDRDYQTWGCTISWLAAAVKATNEISADISSIRIPVMIMQAGKDGMVANEGQTKAAEKNPCITLNVFPESKHEIYNGRGETRSRWYREITAFFDQCSSCIAGIREG